MFVMTYSFSKAAMASRARVQAHRSSSVLALQEGVPRAMDHHSSGCLPMEKFPTFASGRQGRGPVTLLGFRSPFPRAMRRNVFRQESPALVGGFAPQVGLSMSAAGWTLPLFVPENLPVHSDLHAITFWVGDTFDVHSKINCTHDSRAKLLLDQ